MYSNWACGVGLPLPFSIIPMIIVAVIIVIVALLFLVQSNTKKTANAAQATQIQTMKIANGGELPGMTEVEACIRSGNMIGALKAYRTVTGCDLATAQRGVEEIKARMAQPAPKV